VGWAFAARAWSIGSLRIFAGFAGFLQFSLGILPVGCAGLPTKCDGLECYLAVLTLMI